IDDHLKYLRREKKRAPGDEDKSLYDDEIEKEYIEEIKRLHVDKKQLRDEISIITTREDVPLYFYKDENNDDTIPIFEKAESEDMPLYFYEDETNDNTTPVFERADSEDMPLYFYEDEDNDERAESEDIYFYEDKNNDDTTPVFERAESEDIYFYEDGNNYDTTPAFERAKSEDMPLFFMKTKTKLFYFYKKCSIAYYLYFIDFTSSLKNISAYYYAPKRA
ncbi:4336_t:CDS:2, partial [Dentiscutata erythropus]